MPRRSSSKVWQKFILAEQSLHPLKPRIQTDLGEPVINLITTITAFAQVVCGVGDRVGAVGAAAVDHRSQSLYLKEVLEVWFGTEGQAGRLW